MARRVRASTLENRSARLKLTPRKKPYHFVVIAPGIAVGYRRCAGPGRWVLRAADGHGAYWTSTIALADDHEDADGTAVLSYFQAQDKARILVRGDNAGGDRPASVGDALDAYRRDLATRGGQLGNAAVVRKLIPSTLLARPVGLLTFRELRHWRDGLLDGRKASSVNRIAKSLKAAFNLAAASDPRIGNAAVWRQALAGLPDAHSARHVGLPERDVRRLVEAAYAVGPWLGLWAEVAATTGARPSQIARLDAGDLQDERADPRLMMPSSKKGKGHKRIERKPVPIPVALALKLRQAAAERPAGAPLLLKRKGSRWLGSEHVKPFAEVAARAGLAGVTAYALRHSSIIRSLLRGVPVRVIAASHDTSVMMIERSYSAYVLDHSDAVSRAALLDLS
jgi:integrase